MQLFEPMAFFRGILKRFFSGVKFSLYRGQCFDGLVVSFNFMIDSLEGLPQSSSSFSFFLSFSFQDCVSFPPLWMHFLLLQLVFDI